MKPKIVQNRPAESATLVAGAVAFLIGSLAGLSGEQQGALTIVVAAVPSIVTGIVELARR